MLIAIVCFQQDEGRRLARDIGLEGGQYVVCNQIQHTRGFAFTAVLYASGWYRLEDEVKDELLATIRHHTPSNIEFFQK